MIPENTFIHTVTVEVDHGISYATCVFGKLLKAIVLHIIMQYLIHK